MDASVFAMYTDRNLWHDCQAELMGSVLISKAVFRVAVKQKYLPSLCAVTVSLESQEQTVLWAGKTSGKTPDKLFV